MATLISGRPGGARRTSWPGDGGETHERGQERHHRAPAETGVGRSRPSPSRGGGACGGADRCVSLMLRHLVPSRPAAGSRRILGGGDGREADQACERLEALGAGEVGALGGEHGDVAARTLQRPLLGGDPKFLEPARVVLDGIEGDRARQRRQHQYEIDRPVHGQRTPPRLHKSLRPRSAPRCAGRPGRAAGSGAQAGHRYGWPSAALPTARADWRQPPDRSDLAGDG